MVSVRRSSGFMVARGGSSGGTQLGAGFACSEIANADRTVRVEAEDHIEGINHGGRGGDDCPADDAHLALIHVAAPDGKAAIHDSGNAEDESEHHDYGQTVADAGLEIGGVETRSLRKGGDGVEREQGRDGQEQAVAFQVSVQDSDVFFHSALFSFVRWRIFRRITRASFHFCEIVLCGNRTS